MDTLSRYVDQRVRVAGVTAESTLTRDTVPVNVDAIVFWLVWNAEKSILEIRDVRIPQALEDAMSRQAQAERERQARNILGQAETEIADKFAQAALTYQSNPVALHLRAMNMLYEAITLTLLLTLRLAPQHPIPGSCSRSLSPTGSARVWRDRLRPFAAAAAYIRQPCDR